MLLELIKEMEFVRKHQAGQDRPQRFGVILNHVHFLARIACECRRRRVGIRHHGEISRVSALSEMKVQVSRKSLRFGHALEDGLGSVVAAGGGEQHASDHHACDTAPSLGRIKH